MAGKPIELIGGALPATVQQSISTATTKALQSALKVAVRTMRVGPQGRSRLVHKVLATASGAAGGAFGLATLPIELPVSTIIMLRAIAEIARTRGRRSFRLRKRHSHASKSSHWADAPGSTDASESGYFAVRGVLAKSVTEAARFVAERGLIEEGAPVVVRFITQVASWGGLGGRFSWWVWGGCGEIFLVAVVARYLGGGVRLF